MLGFCLADAGGLRERGVHRQVHGASTRVWTHPSNGEYVLKSNGLCLTDPGSSKTAGTVQQIQACVGTANQKWSGT